MNRLARVLANHALAAASNLLPPNLSTWSRAMACDLAEIGDDRAALRFAAGCLRAAAGLAVATRLRRIGSALSAHAHSTWSQPIMTDRSIRPRMLGLVCGATAVGMGMAYMFAVGAPSRYLLVNLAAAVLGATAWLALGRTAHSRLAAGGWATLALAVPLILTALFAAPIEGAARWVSVGPLSLQVSFIVLPVMLILYARQPDAPGTAAMVAAAMALAIQPDRAMAGVLLVALLALLAARAGRLPIVAAAAAALAFAWTWIAPDALPAVPYVDRILYSAFDVHLLAGLAVTGGAAMLVLPAMPALLKRAGDRPVLLTFGGCWSAAVMASALGDYPTPLVGYGGSAVLGYLLSVALLPDDARSSSPRDSLQSRTAAGLESDRTLSELRAAPSA